MVLLFDLSSSRGRKYPLYLVRYFPVSLSQTLIDCDLLKERRELSTVSNVLSGHMEPLSPTSKKLNYPFSGHNLIGFCVVVFLTSFSTNGYATFRLV